VAGKRNIDLVMDAVADLWSPHVLGEVNDYDIKVANVGGEYVEHVHADTDEILEPRGTSQDGAAGSTGIRDVD